MLFLRMCLIGYAVQSFACAMCPQPSNATDPSENMHYFACLRREQEDINTTYWASFLGSYFLYVEGGCSSPVAQMLTTCTMEVSSIPSLAVMPAGSLPRFVEMLSRCDICPVACKCTECPGVKCLPSAPYAVEDTNENITKAASNAFTVAGPHLILSVLGLLAHKCWLGRCWVLA